VRAAGDYHVVTETVKIQGLLTVDGIRFLFTSFVPNFMGFTAAVQYSTRDDSGNTTQTPNGGDNGDHPSVVNHAYVIGGNLIRLEKAKR